MTLVELLILLLIAGICGSLAQALVGYSRGGCLVSIVLGLIGALIGIHGWRAWRGFRKSFLYKSATSPSRSSGRSSAQLYSSRC